MSDLEDKFMTATDKCASLESENARLQEALKQAQLQLQRLDPSTASGTRVTNPVSPTLELTLDELPRTVMLKIHLNGLIDENLKRDAC